MPYRRDYIVRIAALTTAIWLTVVFAVTVDAAPAPACSGQTLIGIDPLGLGPGGPFKGGVGYVPIYALDASKNAQLAVVDLTVPVTSPVLGVRNPVLKLISLPGSDQPIGVAYNPNNQTMLVEGRLSSNNAITIYEIDTTTQSLKNTVAAPGLSQDGIGGGILEDPIGNRAYVAGGLGAALPGSGTLGILDTSKSPPVWSAASVVNTDFTDSLSFNPGTGILFISGDGTNSVIDTTESLSPVAFDSSFGITDGNAFDLSTNIMVLSHEVTDDTVVAFNFNTLSTSGVFATALNVTVPNVCPGGGTGCVGEADPIGEGPGGQTAINCATHQAVVADEFGQNIKLVHLPAAPVPGTLNNNGRPGSHTTPDAASVFTVAGAIIPKGSVGPTAPAALAVLTQLGIVGDPNSLTVDPANNLAYMLADTIAGFHEWQIGSGTPLFLVRMDLSNPVVGSSPTGGVDGKTFWFPTSAAIPMPSGPSPTPTHTPTPTPTHTPTPTPTPTQTPTLTPTLTPTATATPTPTPTFTATTTPSASPTPTPGVMAMGPPSPRPTTVAPGTPNVAAGCITLQNNMASPVTIPNVTIKFDNADLFTLTTLTGTVPSDPFQKPVTAMFIPTPSTSDIAFTYKFIKGVLTVAPHKAASFCLTVTVSDNPQITLQNGRAVYAGLFGGAERHGAAGLGSLSGALILLSLCTGIVGSRRRTMIALMILLLVAASQVGCDNGSVPSSSGGPPASTQNATGVTAKQESTTVAVGGFGPNSRILMSTIVAQQ